MLGVGVPLLLDGLASSRHLFLPACLFFFKQLQQNVVAVDQEDRTYITRMQPGDAVLEFLSEVCDSKCPQVSSCSSRRVGGVLPGQLFKRFAFLDPRPEISSLGICLYHDRPHAQVLRCSDSTGCYGNQD